MDTTATATTAATIDRAETIDWQRALAGRASRLKPSDIREFLKLLGRPGIISFAGGIPDPALFPAGQIAETAAAILADPVRRTQALQYAPSDGYQPLRAWIAAHMTRLWAPCTVDNILLTTGSQQVLDLIGKVLLDPGDTVLTTAPAYLGALQAFELYEPDYATRPIDRFGEHPGAGHQPGLAYAVPDFSNPSGETLSLPQRERLLDTATALDIPVIEDAAYQALRFEGEALPSLLALDIMRTGSIERSRVIYTGTFSKTIAPGLRVGWICASRTIVQTLLLARQAADLHSSSLDQMLVHGVVASGFDEQIGRILPVYRHRRDHMLAALDREMPRDVRWTRPEGGMFIWLTLPAGLDSRQLIRESIEQHGVVFVPGTAFFPSAEADAGARHIRLNYTCSDDATIDDGIARLGQLFRQHQRQAAPRGTPGRATGMNETLLPVVLFAVAMTVSPGSNNVLLASSGVQLGMRRSVTLGLGIVTGIVVLLGVAVMGLGTLVHEHPSLRVAMQALGSAYLLWLGWKIAHAGAPDLGAAGRGSHKGFAAGFINTMLNPKGWTMALSAAASYTAIAPTATRQALILSLIFVVVFVPNWVLWTGGGQAIGRSVHSDHHWRTVNRILGLLVVASIIPIWLE